MASDAFRPAAHGIAEDEAFAQFSLLTHRLSEPKEIGIGPFQARCYLINRIRHLAFQSLSSPPEGKRAEKFPSCMAPRAESNCLWKSPLLESVSLVSDRGSSVIVFIVIFFRFCRLPRRPTSPPGCSAD